jgi:hypothetical protein
MGELYEPKSAFEENWAKAIIKNTLRANASKSSHVIIEEGTDGETFDSPSP